jgi:hypothetical protein
MTIVMQEEEEEGEGDSNCSASEAKELICCSYDAWKERFEVLVQDDTKNFIDDSLPNYTLVAKPLGENLSVARREPGWLPNPQKEEAGEPLFIDVDNPAGLWDEYTFKPKFAQKASKDYRKGQYVYHSQPTGARPVPADEMGSRNRARWEFHYGVWTNLEGNTF